MMSVDSTAGSARLWGRSLLLASTALVGFRTRPAPKPTVLHVPASLLRARVGRLLTLAVETPASLLARLNPLRTRKVRPAARVGRRKWLEAMRGAAIASGLLGASAAMTPVAAQSFGGGTITGTGTKSQAANSGVLVTNTNNSAITVTNVTVNNTSGTDTSAGLEQRSASGQSAVLFTYGSNSLTTTVSGGAGLLMTTTSGGNLTWAQRQGGSATDSDVLTGSYGAFLRAAGFINVVNFTGNNTYTANGTAVAGIDARGNGTRLILGSPIISGFATGIYAGGTGGTEIQTTGGSISGATTVGIDAQGPGGNTVSSGSAITASSVGIRASSASGGNSVTTITGGTINSAAAGTGTGILVSATGGTGNITINVGAAIGGTTAFDTGVSAATSGGATGTVSITNASAITATTAINIASDNAGTLNLLAGSTTTGNVVSTGAGSRTVTVSGALNGAYTGGTATGAVNFTLGATGTMQAATFGSANDTFTYQGGIVGGAINAGAGTDALVSDLGTGGTGTLNQSTISNFETYEHRSGTLTLTGSYGGALTTTVTGGRLIAQNTGTAFGTIGTVAISSGATVELNNNTGAANNIDQTGTTFTGTGTLEKTGNGIVTIGQTGGGSSVSLGSGGLISVQAGTLRASAANAGNWSANQGGLTVASGAIFDTREVAVRVDGLNGGGVVLNNFGGSLTVGVAGRGGTFSGTIQNGTVDGTVGGSNAALALTKTGAGTQILTGASTYTGATTISGGILQIGNGGATGSLAAASAFTVASGATLALNRTGTLAFGNAVSGAGALTVSGGTAGGDLITLSGTLAQTGGFTVANAANVTVAAGGSFYGVKLNGGTFTNLGLADTRTVSNIPSNNPDAIQPNGGGTVTNGAANATGATIRGGGSGIGALGSGTTAINNYGLIVGRDYAGAGQISGNGTITINNLNGTTPGTGGVIYGQGTANSGWGAFNSSGGGLTVANESAAKIVGRVYGVYGTGAATNITNAGRIASGSYDEASGVITVGGTAGIQLNAGGTVTNQATGLIDGAQVGVFVGGAGATITNNGTVRSVGGRGIDLQAGGSIDNRLGGTIQHTGTANNNGGAGVFSNGTLTLTNGGIITTTSTGASDGVTVLSVATITNTGTRVNGALTGGLIRASNASGLALVGAGSSVTNSGTIQGGTSASFGYGVAFTNTGTVINQTGGLIVGTLGGVRSGGAATITNAGTIGTGSADANGAYVAATTGSANALTLAAGGTVTNQNGGVIDSGGRGVSLGAAGTVDNQLGGIIRHTGTADNGTGNGAGVYASGNLTLTNGGTITTAAGGGNDGVTVLGVANITNTGTIQAANASSIAIAGAGSSVTNSGTIQGGTSSVAVNLNNGGTINNQTGGLIAGSLGGLTSAGSGAAIITNDGTIRATGGGNAIALGAGGTIDNGSTTNTAALITTANGSAIDTTGSAATTVNNYGRIQGTNFSGAGQASGTGAFTLNNLGTASVVYGTGNLGAYNLGSGALTVGNEGLIVSGGTTNSNSAAIRALGTATITNSGTIGIGSITGTVFTANTASIRNAVTLAAGGTVSNTGTISGGTGIDANLTSAANITVTGNGTITGTSGFGVRAVSGSGNVVLGTTGAALGAISGVTNGILAQTGSAGTIGIVTGGNVTATGASSAGISATTLGAGTVTVSVGPITTTNGTGLVATGTSGVVAVTANGAIQAGGAGNAGVFLTGNNASNTVTVGAGGALPQPIVQGAIGLRLAGTGTTALVNNGTLATTGGAGANAVQIDGGTLVVGNTAGTLSGNLAVVNAGSTLSVDRTADLALANVVTGAGTLNKGGASRLTLTGVNGVNNQFTGTVNVTAGTLAVNGTLGDTAGNAATVNVATGATLNGTGTIAGSVNVNTGATVSAGNSPGTLTIGGNYTLNAGSTSLFELGAPNSILNANNDLIVVRGNLQLGGTLSLVSATNAAVAPVSGVYRLYDYGGTLTGAFGAVLTPTGTTSTASVYTTVPNQVNLLIANANTGGGGGGGGAGPVTPVTPVNPGTPVTPVNPGTPVIPVTPVAPGGQAVQFWDGADTSGAVAGMQGGSGTWASGTTNWTTVAGDANTAWRSGVGIFSGTAGVVTVAGAQGVQGLQFTTDGYALAGTGTLTLLGDVTSPTRSFVNVDAGVGATIANALTGATGEIGLNKLGTGTLTLTGASTYTGTTQVAAGTLVVAAGGALASAVTVDTSAVLVNAGTLGAGLTNAGSASTSGTVAAGASNTGRLANTGTLNGGLVNATGATTNAGTINGGATIVSGSLTTTGIVNGAVANGGTIRAQGQLNGTVANQAGATFTQTGALTGIGRLTNDGTVDLGGNDLGIGSLAGTNAGARIVNGGTLSAGSDGSSSAYAGAITGATSLTKTGAGTLTLSGANTSTGTTGVQAGGLINTGSLAGGVSNAAIFTNTGSVAGLLANGGNVLTSGTLAGGLSNIGDVTALAGRIDGAVLNNAGTLSITGRVAGNGTFANAAAATLAVSGTYDLAGLLTNAGGLTVASGGNLTAPAGIVNSGAITVAQGGTITDALANTGRVVNDGTYNADVSNAGPGTLANRATGVWNGTLTANTASVTNAGLWQGNARNDVGGTLANSGTWTTASAPIANAGTLSNTGTVNGGVANSGGFTNAGTLNGGLSNLAGTTTNTGTINGAVAVTGGSLATTGTLNGALTNAATVTASGRIAGSVTNLAGANFTLTGPLSGVTRLSNDGAVDLGGTALSVGSLSGTNLAAVLRNGTLTAAGDETTTYAGTITDGAAATGLIKTGTGTLTLTGANTFTGGTTILSGTLVASAANLGGGPVTNNNTLVIDQAGDATLSDTINGTGRFIKQGAGSLTYTGTGTLSGATLVSAGRLSVNGSLANSVVNVASAASLGGTGVVGGVVVNGGGAVAPGASPGAVGTLRVAGNVLFASQSLYQVDATASGQSDRIAASGTATLQGGTVQVTAQPGLYAPSTRYTVLTAAGGLTGQFANVTANFAFLTPTLAYGNTDVTLQLARNDIAFGTTAQTRNQGAVAAAAQATGPGARLYDAIAVLSAPQSRAAYDALSGEIHASAITAQFETATLIREAVLDRLRWGDSTGFGSGLGSQGIGQRFAPGTTVPAAYTADLPGRAPSLSTVPARFVDPQPITAWGQGFGAFGSTATNGNAARLDRQTSGFVLGADARVENDWRIGAAGGYTVTNLDITGRLSTGSVESGYGALYAGGGAGPLQVRLGASYGGNSLTTRRAVIFAGLGENAGARYGGSTAQGFAEAGYRFGTALGTVEPFLGGAVIRIGRNAFNETGGAAALTAAGRDYDLATSTVGVRAEAQLGAVLGSDLPILVRALVGYRRAYGDVVPSALLAFTGGQSFVTAGIPIDRDALVTQAGLDWQVARGTTLGVAYTGQVGTRAQDHGVKGNFTLRF